MNEIDLVGRFRAAEPSRRDETEVLKARSILLDAIEREKNRTHGSGSGARRVSHPPFALLRGAGSSKLKKTVGAVLAIGALVVPFGIALAQNSSETDGPTPQELMSEDARQDVIDGYEAAREICKGLTTEEFINSPCERVMNGGMLGAPENMP
jgi:hypothetical protein